MSKLKKYVYTEYLEVKVIVNATDEESAAEAGSDFIDALFYDSLTLHKHAKQISKKHGDCEYMLTNSTGDSEVQEYKS